MFASSAVVQSADFAPVTPATVTPVVLKGLPKSVAPKSVAPDLPLAVLPIAKGVTMSELKTALPQYFSPAEVDQCAINACADDSALRLDADVALITALTRHALISAHSGTVNADILAKCLQPFSAALAASKGTAKTRAQFRAAGLASVVLAISNSKNSLKGCTLERAQSYASAFEEQASASLQYIKPETAVKAKPAIKSASAKIIAAIQGASFTADELKAIKAALANCKAVEPAPL